MQTQHALITNIIDSIKDGVEKIRALQMEDEAELPFPAVEGEEGDVKIQASATNLPATALFREKNQLTDEAKAKSQQLITIHRHEISVKKVFQGKQSVKKIRDNLLPLIADAIKNRFKSFEEDIYQAMYVIDHHRWDYENSNYGIEDIQLLSTHFFEPLEKYKFDLQASKFEFRQLKKLVNSKYRHLTYSTSLWRVIFQQHAQLFPNILLIMEIILCISTSSSKRLNVDLVLSIVF